MAIRTTDALVIAVLGNGSEGGDYDNENSRSLTRYIRAANILVNAVSTCMVDNDLTPDSDVLTELETWLAAHFYQASDQGYAEKRTERAMGKFHGQTGKYLEGTKYGQAALTMDTSGCLAEISMAQHATATWGGKTPEEQIDYEDRGGNYLT